MLIYFLVENNYVRLIFQFFFIYEKRWKTFQVCYTYYFFYSIIWLMPMKQYYGIEISTNQSVHGQKVPMIKQLKSQLMVSSKKKKVRPIKK